MTKPARMPERGEVEHRSTKRGQLVARRPLAPGAFAFRVPDAAQMLGVSTSKLWKMIAEKEIEARKIGAATVIRAEELKAYIDAAAPVTKAAQSSIKARRFAKASPRR